MGIRAKTLLLTSLTLAGLLAILYFISQTILLDGFVELLEKVVIARFARLSAEVSRIGAKGTTIIANLPLKRLEGSNDQGTHRR
ncbi:MAG: hypothetical protein ACREOO_02850 [bacterium]